MGHGKTQAWVTSAVDEDSVTGALVLAKSLRKTRTTRPIVCITSANVSLEKRLALRETFDQVLLLDETHAPRKIGGTQAKVYTFALTLFEKCVFVSPQTLVLENVDHLFDTKFIFQSLINPENGRLDMSVFMVEPNRELWDGIWKSVKWDGEKMTDDHVSEWLANQKANLKMGPLPEGLSANFDLSTEELKCDATKTHAPFIQFVHGQIEQLRSLQNAELGLPETLIVDAWLDFWNNLPSVSTPMSCEVIENPLENYKSEPIAIVGMSCRYPGANSLEEFWKMLYAGEEGIREPPSFRWTKEHTNRVSAQDRKSAAGFLSCPVDEFDARFFGVSPKEAAYMDPQARLLHEVLWESLEDAGIDPLSLYGTHTGIFTGSWMNDYKDIVTNSAEKDFFRTYMGNSIGATAARLSFLLGLTGPSIATESGCSSAIVALDLAVKSLREGETNLALAAGVNLLLHPFNSSMMEYVISPNGRCKTFDANADGFGRAEGCGVLVLKRLGDALRDRDHIWALIRGSAVAQEGLSRSLGTPTVQCEALAMQMALQDANVEPEHVSFVETHGTGTQVGDPMEVSAISKAYYSPHRTTPLIIGSVKTNVGHTESCSGITGIMKAVLALQHEAIPQHRNLETLNPEIFLDSIPAVIPHENMSWPRIPGQPRICGVSSFGITGTDGHVIIEESPDLKLPKFGLGMERNAHLMTVSAKCNEALMQLLTQYENRFAAQENEEDFAHVAFSANVGRGAFNHRAVIVARNGKEATRILQDKTFLHGEIGEERNNRQLCFLFTGQGSQYSGMAKTLYETSPIFRVNFDLCDRKLRKMYNVNIRQVLWGEVKGNDLGRTIYSQTSIFCVEYCLLRLWQSWGIQPTLVLGHSLGEFCAAVAVGVLDFEDALRLVAERSRLIDSLPRGSMLVIKANRPEVEKMMVAAKVDLDLAAVNTSEQTVVAGDTTEAEKFLAYLKAHNVKATMLDASHAFHSRHMDPMLKQYKSVAQSVIHRQGNPNIQYISGMEGRLIEDLSEIGADYWVRHTREKVNFMGACTVLRECDCQNFLEVGPQPVLSSFIMTNNENQQINCLPSLRRGQDDWMIILTTLGKLYLGGYPVDWKAFDEPYNRKKVSLPFHPFMRKSFWVECTNSNASLIHPLLGAAVKNASSLHIFQNDLSLKAVPYLKDHCIGSRVIFPGAGYTEMCLTAGYCVANAITETLEPLTRAITLENLRIDAPLELHEGKNCRFQSLVDLPQSESEDAKGFRVKVFHQSAATEEGDKWVLHASATFLPMASNQKWQSHWNEVAPRLSLMVSDIVPTSPDTFYKQVEDQGLKFGSSFRAIRRFWSRPQANVNPEVDEVITEIEMPVDTNKYLLHPLIIDAVFQTGILTRYAYEKPKLKVPVHLGQLTVFPESTASFDHLYIHAWKSDKGRHCLFVCTPNWTPVAYVEHVEMVTTNVITIESVLEQQNSAVPDAWEEVWKPLGTRLPSVDENPISVETAFGKQDTPEYSVEERRLLAQSDRLVYLQIAYALVHQLNWRPKPGSTWTVASLCTHLGINTEFHQLAHFYLTEIGKEEDGFLEQIGSVWCVTSAQLPSAEAIEREMEELKTSLGNSRYMHSTRIQNQVAQDLAQFLRGEKSPLALLFPREEDSEGQQYSADTYYKMHPSKIEQLRVCDSLCRSIFLQNVHPEKVFRVLEVGAGTGSLTKILLNALHDCRGTAKFEIYFTDISQAFFTKAEGVFEEFRDHIKFALFNLEESPLSQGIPLNYFDMVAATDVLHATRNLEETLLHLRQTLKPGGVLFFTETVVPLRDVTSVFGLLSGYWRFEDKHVRRHHCCVELSVWAELLNRCGFKGKMHSMTQHMGRFAVIWAVADGTCAVEKLVPPSPKKVEDAKEWMIFGDHQDMGVTRKLADWLVASGYHVELVTSAQLDSENGFEVEAFILEKKKKLNGIIFALGLREEEVDQRKLALPLLRIMKTLVTLLNPPQLYVLTKEVRVVHEDGLVAHPSGATLAGMVKSLKNEISNIITRVIDLERNTDAEEMVMQVLHELGLWKGSKEVNRWQVAYRGGVRHEPKLVKATLSSAKDALQLPPSTDRYQLKLPDTRMIQDLKFEAVDTPVLGEGEVEVKVVSWALNFRDIFAILKPSAAFEKLDGVGIDFSGEVVRTEGNNSKWKVGDRVFGANLKEAQLPSHLVVNSKAIVSVPQKMSHWEAVTLPAVFITAYHCLITLAGLKKEDTVLIHTASGGVGLAAIQVARRVGATIITTAGNPRKRAYLQNLGIEHVFHSRDISYEADILRVTNGHGVDVVLNSITGPGVKEATLRCTAVGGRFVEMSKLNVWSPEGVKALRPDVHYSIVDLMKLDMKTNYNLVQKMQEFLTEGTLKAIPFVRFDVLHLRQALQYFQKAKHIGKLVITMPTVVTKEGQFKTEVPLFNSDSTYLITGGFGGIGFEVCKWMLKKGASDIVLVGRTPPKPEVASVIEKLNQSGANVLVRLGDVANIDECNALIDEISQNGKPLRGVMHCAGVLRDNLYSNQTWPDFEATYQPKIQGTWNLHQTTLTCPLEHFVVYSSVTALVGTPAQPNHVSANCFQDAFIHFRHSLGLPGTTINWGQWAEVGCAREVNMGGMRPVSVQRMLNGMEALLRTPSKRQVCFNDFTNFEAFNNVLCPSFRHYLDDRLWKASSRSGALTTQLSVNSEQFWQEMENASGSDGKSAVLIPHLKRILRVSLRLEPEEPLSEDANLQELGVDSLMMIELKNSIQTLLGNRLTVTSSILKNCNTLRQLADTLVQKLLEEEETGQKQKEDETPLEPLSSAELSELLNEDSVLDENVKPEPDCTASVQSSEIKTFLVTGITGQVAPYLVAHLLKAYGSVEKVWCLVRGKTERVNASLEGMEVDMGRIEPIVGDVAKVNLGLFPEKYAELCENVDAILHCAAKTHPSEHLRPTANQNNIRTVNIGGMVNILRFACKGKVKRVYYPSTLICGVFGESGRLNDRWPELGVIDTIVNNKLPGLQSSKWICEMLLKQANERGIPCKVFRLPWVGGHSKTGRVINPLSNMYILRFLLFLKMGAMPMMVIPANVLPVDLLAEVTLRLFMSDDTPNEIFNIAHPHPDVEQEFVRVAQEEFGKQVDILEEEELNSRLKKQSADEVGFQDMYGHQKSVSTHLSDVASFVTGYFVAPKDFFNNEKVSSFIENYGNNYPSSMETLTKDFRYLHEQGLLTACGVVK